MINDLKQRTAPPALGILEWFRPGEYERVEAAIADLKQLNIRHLRTGISWADFHGREIESWYDWLLPLLGAQFELVPSVFYVPPSISMSATAAGPPKDPKAYADFLDLLITRYGAHFDTVELWNEPNNLNDWDWRLDPTWSIFSDMLVKAAYWMRQRGKRTLLGGTCPLDLNWLSRIALQGGLADIDVVGLHGFPGTWQSAATWRPWQEQIDATRAVLDQHGIEADIWITEAGYSTWRHDELAQIDCFLEVMEARVSRVYWYAYQDLHPSLPSQEGWHFDERHYHFGMVTAGGKQKLLRRMLEHGGLEAVRRLHALQGKAPAVAGRSKPVVITGGAGFLGCNLAKRLAARGDDVLILDSLRRNRVEENLAYLKERFPRRIAAEIADIRDPYVINHALVNARAVFHFAAQVAVTTSLVDPNEDFETNLRGTLNVLEALRHVATPPPTLFASTNKVYGGLDGLGLEVDMNHYLPIDREIRRQGIGCSQPLEFCSPYGCSKGAADQYVLDYGRSYGLPTAILRMSCLYGPHQFGTEDQGWVAHFLLSALEDLPITIFGDGRQVRDILYVDDAVNAYITLLDAMPRVAARAFNLGGGPANAVSLLELIRHIETLLKRNLRVEFDDWRTGDQRYYVSDTTALRDATGWRAETRWQDGVGRLLHWLVQNGAKSARPPMLKAAAGRG